MTTLTDNELVGFSSKHGVYYTTVDKLVEHFEKTTVVAGDVAIEMDDRNSESWYEYIPGSDVDETKWVSVSQLANDGWVPIQRYVSSDGNFERIDVVEASSRLSLIPDVLVIPSKTRYFRRNVLNNVIRCNWKSIDVYGNRNEP